MTIKFPNRELIFNVPEANTTNCAQQSVMDDSKSPKCRLRGGGLPSPISIIPQSPLFSNMAAGCQTTMPIMCYPPFSPQQHQSLVNASYQCYPVLMYASQSPFQPSLPYPCCSPPTIILALPHLPPTSFSEDSGRQSWMPPGEYPAEMSEGEVSPQTTSTSYEEPSSATQETFVDMAETRYMSLPPRTCPRKIVQHTSLPQQASPRKVVKQGTLEGISERTHTSLPQQASPRKVVKQGIVQDLDEGTRTCVPQQASPRKVVKQGIVQDLDEGTRTCVPQQASPRKVVKQGIVQDLDEGTCVPQQASPRKVIQQGMLENLDERTHANLTPQASPIKALPTRFCPVQDGSPQSKLSPVKMHFLRNKPSQLGGFPPIKKGLLPSAVHKKILPFQLLSPVEEAPSYLERSYRSPIKPAPQPGVNNLMTSLSESRRTPSKKHSWSHEKSLYTSTPKNTFTAEAAPPGTAANVDHRHFLEVEGLSPIPIERPAPTAAVKEKERSYHDSDFKELLCDDESSEIQNSIKTSIAQGSPEFFDLQCSSMSNVELDSKGGGTPGSLALVNPDNLDEEKKFYLNLLNSIQHSRREQLKKIFESFARANKIYESL